MKEASYATSAFPYALRASPFFLFSSLSFRGLPSYVSRISTYSFATEVIPGRGKLHENNVLSVAVALESTKSLPISDAADAAPGMAICAERTNGILGKAPPFNNLSVVRPVA